MTYVASNTKSKMNIHPIPASILWSAEKKMQTVDDKPDNDSDSQWRSQPDNLVMLCKF